MRLRFMPALKPAVVLATLVLLFTARPSRAQDFFGTINGTVTDNSGAAVPNAGVTITNELTKISHTVYTNDQGFYVAADLPVGTYTVAAKQKGFKVTTKTGGALFAGDHLTVDITLQLGEASETVQVTTSAVQVNKTSGEISRTIDMAQVQNLALNQRNFVQLETLVPGAALMNNGSSGNGFDYTASTTGMGLEVAAMNGLRPDANLTTVDGGFNQDSGSNASMVNNVGIDFVQEVTVDTSNYSAEFGRSSATTINVVTQGGGDQYHGDLFEYFENNALNAALDSNKWSVVPGAGGYTAAQKRAIRPELRYNDFGGKFGGPIFRGKLYFIVGEEAKRLVLDPDSTSLNNQTLPTVPELSGNFGDAQATPGSPCVIPAPLATNPCNLHSQGIVPASCIGNFPATTSTTGFVPSALFVGASAYGTAINPACITAGGADIAKVFAAQQAASIFSGQPTTNNATFSPVGPQNIREDFVRIDYHPTAHHDMFFRYIHDKIQLVDPFGTFSPAGLPTSPTLRSRPGWNYQLSDVWTISPTLVNEAKINISWNAQRIPPFGNSWSQTTYGFNTIDPKTGQPAYVEAFPGAGSFPTGLPQISFSGCSGNVFCPSHIDGPSFSLIAPTTDISPQDNMTWTHASHTIRWGLSFTRNRKDQNPRQTYNGDINFSSSASNANTTGDPFADALLGNYNTFSQVSGDGLGHFRFNDWGAYVADSWRASHNLSFDLGMRVDYTVPTYTQGNNMTSFDPALYATDQAANPITVNLKNQPVEMTAGNHLDCLSSTTSPGGACSTGGYDIYGLTRPGDVPGDQVVRVQGADSPFVLAVPDQGQRGLYKTELVWAPRVGVAYAIGNKTSIRAGFGIFYDKPEGNLVFSQPGIVPFLSQVSYNNGNMGAAPSGTFTPTIIGLSAINPNLRVARDMQYSVSVERELPGGLLVQGAFVGNHGWHLLRQPDINVPTFATAAADSAAAVASGTNILGNDERPYLGFTNISQYNADGYSNYDGAQFSAVKRKSFLTFQISYTYERTLATNSGEGDNPYPACAFVCTLANGSTVPWQQYWYGPVGFDIANVFVAAFTVENPFFKNKHGVEGAVLGGWQLSGMAHAQSGSPLTASGTQNVGPAAASGQPGVNSVLNVSGRPNLNPGVPLTLSGCPPTPPGKINTVVCFFNPAAFSQQPNNGMGNAPVGDLIGPGYYAWDLSLRKNVNFGERMHLLLEWDAFNVFNRVNYTNPGTGCGNGANCQTSFGQIGSTYPPRQVQLAAKFNF